MSDYYNFENLECWRQARDLATDMYRISMGKNWIGGELLGNSLRQASLAVMTKIAEGKERGSDPEFLFELQKAKGQTAAFRSSLIVSREAGFLTEADYLDFHDRANRVAALIGGLINAIKKNGGERHHNSTAKSQPLLSEEEVPF
jgi:four helix bundle protein